MGRRGLGSSWCALAYGPSRVMPFTYPDRPEVPAELMALIR